MPRTLLLPAALGTVARPFQVWALRSLLRWRPGSDSSPKARTFRAAYSDDIAALIAGAVLRVGAAVSERLSVIGHDDSPIAALLVPSLSSVRRDREQAQSSKNPND